jgi:ABC-type dipeptide/oligopeptide/nickel transport system permease subunit
MTGADLTAASAVPRGIRNRSPGGMAVRRFFRNKIAVGGAVVLVVIVALAVFAPLISSYDPNAVDLRAFRQPPSAEHLLGTDSSGRDVFTRAIYAGRVSLGIGLSASLIAIVLGTLLGAVAGLLGGWVDAVIMRFADIVMSLPSLVVILVVAGILGPSIVTLIVAIGVFGWPVAGRVVRGATLSLREHEFIQAATAVGAGNWWLIRRHILPAVLAPVTVVGTLTIAGTILVEAALSFLGLGVQPPQASWGNMLIDAQNLTLVQTMPWLWLPPGIAIAVTVLSVNFVGDGLRDAVDPRQG